MTDGEEWRGLGQLLSIGACVGCDSMTMDQHTMRARNTRPRSRLRPAPRSQQRLQPRQIPRAPPLPSRSASTSLRSVAFCPLFSPPTDLIRSNNI